MIAEHISPQAVILAAGRSRRMGQSKALLSVGGQTFLDRIIRIYRPLGIEIRIVISDAAIRASCTPAEGLLFLENPNPDDGPLSSLRIALAGMGHSSGFLLHPVDHPLVSPETPQTLLDHHGRDDSKILIPTFEGRKGHPVLFPSCFYEQLRQGPLREGARWVVRRNTAAVSLIDVRDAGILANLNTPAELGTWNVSLE